MENRIDGQYQGTDSRAAIFHHPIHPVLVTFPIAFLTGVLVTDLAFYASGRPFWAEASYWLLIGGIAGGTLAALPGAWDLFAIRQARRLPSAHVHGAGNVLLLGLAIANLWLRWADPAAAINGWGLVLSALTVVLLGITGWLGGELSYRHRIGVMEQNRVATDGPFEDVPEPRRATAATHHAG